MNDLLVARSDVGEFRKRYRWLALSSVVVFLVIIGRLFQLQVIEGEGYAEIAHENVIRRHTLRTTRGVIRDDKDRVIASSRASFNAWLVPGRVMPSARPARRGKEPAPELDPFAKVADTLRLNPDERATIADRIREACKDDDDRGPCWRPILVREDLSRDIVAELKQHKDELRGVDVQSTPVRYYPFKAIGAHMLGYVSEIDAETLGKYRPSGWESLAPEERQNLNPLGYEAGDIIGATGVERAWESHLRGQNGWEKRVVDARGRFRTGPEADRILDAPTRLEPIAGRNLRLTVNMDLIQAVDRAMAPHQAGAVVVTEAKSGRLLAMYSKPSFDPNDLSGGNGKRRVREAFNRVYTDPLRPMLDKTTTGAFQPGSTFKPFSALAALEGSLMDPEERERCDGFLSFGRRIFRCTHVHNKVTMRDAIAVSCNVYFFKLAETVGMDRIARVAREFGLGERTGIGVNPESSGRIPSRAWYALRYAGAFRVGFTLNTAIGQGSTTVTPLQLALAYAALGNGGTVYTPQIVRAIETTDGATIQEFLPRARQTAQVAPANLARIQEALFAVTTDTKGTAFPVHDLGLEIAGKTGTAQTGYVASPGEDPKRAWYYSRDHAWFAAYYPAKAPEISVAVLVEHGGSGPTIAAPIAVQIVRDYERIYHGRTIEPRTPKDVVKGDAAARPR